MTAMFSPPDMLKMADEGAACGHGALAAAFEIYVADAMAFLKPGWVNVPMMKAAITSFGRRWERVDLLSPEDVGLILIQFTGPWTEPGRPPQAACRYRHWVGARNGLIWDANWPEWQTNALWQKRAPQLLPEKGTGWKVWGSLRITDNE